MARRTSDTQMDLLSWEPAEGVVRRYDEARVRAASMKTKISRAVSETMTDSEMSRAEIAAFMSEYLGEPVSVNMLNAYSSPSREDHCISFVRLVALVVATGDPRPLQVAAEAIGHSVIDDKYLPWIEVGQLSEVREEINKKRETALRNARKGTRR